MGGNPSSETDPELTHMLKPAHREIKKSALDGVPGRLDVAEVKISTDEDTATGTLQNKTEKRKKKVNHDIIKSWDCKSSTTGVDGGIPERVLAGAVVARRGLS